MEQISSTALCAVLIGKGTSTQTQKLARNMQGCPYVASYNAKDDCVVGVFVLPQSKRWWIEYPEERPELLGLEQVTVLFTEKVIVSSPWLRGKVEPTAQIAPCETNCAKCPQYRVRCVGCPATVYYRAQP